MMWQSEYGVTSLEEYERLRNLSVDPTIFKSHQFNQQTGRCNYCFKHRSEILYYCPASHNARGGIK